MRPRAVNSPREMTGSDASALQQATHPDLLTVAAIAIVATVIGDLIHEGPGHGGMCSGHGRDATGALYCAL